ncbi:MAG: LAGLIDADG family homing endonuclease [Halanaerobiales bacterium]
MNESKLSWCGGFFDGEGYFSFSAKCPLIGINNTNPLVVSNFFEIMKNNDIDFKIIERNKVSKKAKKKRWDMYIMNKNNIVRFCNIMKDYIHGKKNQLFLINNFYDECLKKKRTYCKIAEDYYGVMKFFNQTSNIIILDKNKLIEKIDDNEIDLQYVEYYDENEKNDFIKTNSFNDLDYLSGLLDAEGTIYINKRKVKNKRYDRYVPFISIVNTNKKIIQNYCSVLKNNDIPFHVQSRINNKRNRIRWDVSVVGVKRVYNFSKLLSNKLIIKNRQNDLIHKYCSLRLKDMLSKNDIGKSFKESIEILNKEN